MRDEPNTGKRQLYFPLLFLAGFLLASAVVGIEKESLRMVPIFILIVFTGTAVMVERGLSRGGLISLLMISAWIAAKQITGVWDAERLWTSFLEVILMGAAFLFGGILHDRIGMVLDELLKAQNKIKQLDFEDKSVGLIKPSIGLLHLQEEEDRSRRFHRPFALVLIEVIPSSEDRGEPNDSSAIMRAIAVTVKDATRLVDFPFLTPSGDIAILLPETDKRGANRVVDHIQERMVTTRYITSSGQSVPVQERAQLHFGLAAFTGDSDEKIDALVAAERSIQQGVGFAADNLFSNPAVETEQVLVGKINDSFWAIKNNGEH